MIVFLYQDYVHNNGVLHRVLRAHFGADNVRRCDAAGILDGILEKAALLVMPGGADLYYCEKLNGAGNRAIRNFVEGGGTYLGICAGAYYACAELEWARNEKDPICGPRELGFYKGKAVGPVYEFIEDNDFNKSWDGVARIMINEQCNVFYSGGPVFEGDENAAVIARYDDLPGRPAAAVECAVGKGKAILCSPHLEYDAESYRSTIYRHRNASYEWQQSIAGKLATGQQEGFRKAIFNRALPEGGIRHAA